MNQPDYQLHRNAFGRIVFTAADGSIHEDVVPVRAFPIAEPERGIALVTPHGRELAWIDRLEDLPEALRQIVEAELSSREFMPVIKRITRVSGFATPSTWQVETSHGATELILKGEEDIRRLPGSALLIADVHGINYLVRDRLALDLTSRKILDRFL